MRKPEIIPECHFLSDCNGYCIFSKTLWSRIIRYPMIFQFQKKLFLIIFLHFWTWNIFKILGTLSRTLWWQNISVVHFNLHHPPTTTTHFDQARRQVALPVLLVALNKSLPVLFIRDIIQLVVKWVDNSLVVRAKVNLDKLTQLLQIHILNFNLNLIKIKQ